MAEITEKTIEGLVTHHFDTKPKKIVQLTGGLANIVFAVEVKGEEFVVRANEHAWKLQFFQKEQWATREVRALGVPAPEVLEVGSGPDGMSYTIQRKAVGMPAGEHPNRIDIIREMGKYAAVINSVPTKGYGHVFGWSDNKLSYNNTWKEFLEKERKVDEAIRVFEKHRILTQENMRKFKKGLKSMAAWKGKPALAHYDLRLKNVLVDEKSGKITSILDWDDCRSLIAPQWELSAALHDLNIDEQQVFLQGYGMSERRYRQLSSGIKVINMLWYCEHIVALAENNEKEELDHRRSRLNGHFDLYSL